MAGYKFWEWSPESEVRQERADSFVRVQQDRLNQRDAGAFLDHAGGMLGSLFEGARSRLDDAGQFLAQGREQLAQALPRPRVPREPDGSIDLVGQVLAEIDQRWRRPEPSPTPSRSPFRPPGGTGGDVPPPAGTADPLERAARDYGQPAPSPSSGVAPTEDPLERAAREYGKNPPPPREPALPPSWLEARPNPLREEALALPRAIERGTKKQAEALPGVQWTPEQRAELEAAAIELPGIGRISALDLSEAARRTKNVAMGAMTGQLQSEVANELLPENLKREQFGLEAGPLGRVGLADVVPGAMQGKAGQVLGGPVGAVGTGKLARPLASKGPAGAIERAAGRALGKAGKAAGEVAERAARRTDLPPGAAGLVDDAGRLAEPPGPIPAQADPPVPSQTRVAGQQTALPVEAEPGAMRPPVGPPGAAPGLRPGELTPLQAEAARLEQLPPGRPGLPRLDTPAARAAGDALTGGVAGATAAAEQEGAAPQDIARGALIGAAGGAATGVARRALFRQPGLLARAVEESGEQAGVPGAGLPPGARPITLSTPEEIARLRLDKFPEEVRDELQKAATEVDWARTQRRGVIPDAVADSLAERLGRSFESWTRSGKPGRAYNVEETLALRNAATAQAVKVYELTEEIATTRAGGATPDLLIARRAAEAGKLEALVKLAEGARAEAGRALRAYQAQARLIEQSPDQAVERIYTKLGGRDKAAQAVDEYTKLVQGGADPVQMAHFWARVEKPPPGFGDWFQALRYNSMLSGPRTFEINAVGSVTEFPWRLARDVGASTVRGRPEELAPELAGLLVGARRGWGAALQVLRSGITEEQALRGDLPRGLAARLPEGSLQQRAASTLEVPGRIMGATDELFRQMAYSMALGRFAAVRASREGLRGKAWAARVTDILAEPDPKLMERALAVGDRLTYKNEMGGLGKGLEAFRRANPTLGNLLIPFLKTVYNITGRGIDRSPLGIVGTTLDVAGGKYGRNLGAALAGEVDLAEKGLAPLGERLGDNALGGLLGVGFALYALQGNISAAGPDAPRERDALRAQGWMPYSIKLGDNWISYANWGPVSVAMSAAGAFAEAQRYKQDEAGSGEIALDMFRRFGELATEQTYLQGLGDIWDGIKDPERSGGRLASGLLGSLIPFGAALNTVGQMQDPYVRSPATGDVGQALSARLPGARESVPRATDVLGRPIENVFTGAKALQPFRVSPEREDKVLQEFSRLKLDMPKVGKKIGGRELSPAQARAYSQAAQQTRAALAEKLIASPVYKRADDAERARLLEAAMGRAAAWASHQVAPGELRTGREILAPALGGDPERAIDGYVRALSAQAELEALAGSRYAGKNAEQAAEIAQDRQTLAAYRAYFGEVKGETLFRARVGHRRANQALHARTSPAYTRKARAIRRQNPDLALFFGGGGQLAELPEPEPATA